MLFRWLEISKTIHLGTIINTHKYIHSQMVTKRQH